MLKKLAILIIFLNLFLFYFPPKTLAINPPGPNVRPIPPVIFVMDDWTNGDWGNPNYSYTWTECVKKDDSNNCLESATHTEVGHPEWGPVGGWHDFNWGYPRRAGAWGRAYIDEYIKDAAKMTVTLDDGTKIRKPIGVGIPFTLENIKDYEYLKDANEFPNLAFIVASAPGIDPNGCNKYGEVTECMLPWAQKIMKPLSEAFPNIPIFFQGDIHTLGGLAEQAVTLPNKNIAVKANGWTLNLDYAHKTLNGILSVGEMTFADFYHDRIMVGFEPKHGYPMISSYLASMNALSEHPDFFDIPWLMINDMAVFEKTYGFPLLRFTRDYMAKTVKNSPDVWLVLRETPYETGCGCPEDTSCLMASKCCWTQGAEQTRICTGPEWGNFSFFLYQKEVSGGKTMTEFPTVLPQSARTHPYSLGNRVRRTNQATGNVFMAFDVDDGYRTHQAKPKAAGGNSVLEMAVTFVNKGNDSLSLEYKNYSGDLIKKTIQKGPALGAVDNWVDYTFTVDDAYFNNNLDGGIDFRINCNNDGDEYIHRVIVKSFESCPTPESGNLNNDCLINEKDLTILLSQWQESSAVSLGTMLSNWKSK